MARDFKVQMVGGLREVDGVGLTSQRAANLGSNLESAPRGHTPNGDVDVAPRKGTPGRDGAEYDHEFGIRPESGDLTKPPAQFIDVRRHGCGFGRSHVHRNDAIPEVRR